MQKTTTKTVRVQSEGGVSVPLDVFREMKRRAKVAAEANGKVTVKVKRVPGSCIVVTFNGKVKGATEINLFDPNYSPRFYAAGENGIGKPGDILRYEMTKDGSLLIFA